MARQRYLLLLFTTVLVVIYNDWLLGPLLNPHMSANRALISELSASSQAYHSVFQALDILAGIVTLAALPWLWQFLCKSRVRFWQLLFLTVVLIGADSIADALLPISCAPTVDAGCNLATTHSFLTQAHLAESSLIAVATFIAPLLWWHFCKAKHRFIAQSSLWFVGIQLAIACAVLATRFFHIDYTGALQRAYELSISLWVCGILYTALAATARHQTISHKPVPNLSYESEPTILRTESAFAMSD